MGVPELVESFDQATRIFNSFASTLYNPDWEFTEGQYEQEDNRFDQALTEPNRKLSELMDRRDPRTSVAAFIRQSITKYQKGVNKPE